MKYVRRVALEEKFGIFHETNDEFMYFLMEKGWVVKEVETCRGEPPATTVLIWCKQHRNIEFTDDINAIWFRSHRDVLEYVQKYDKECRIVEIPYEDYERAIIINGIDEEHFENVVILLA